MSSYFVTLLGPPALEGPEGAVHISALKAQAVLWYLAAQPERLFSRAHLAALLWEEESEAVGRNNLSTTLNRLRQALPLWPLRTVGDSLGWEPGVGVAVDVARFADLTRTVPLPARAAGRFSLRLRPAFSGGAAPWRAGEAAPAGPVTLQEREALAAAADLCHGPFLEGFGLPGNAAYDDWISVQRQLWENRILEVLARLGQAEAEVGEWAAVVTHARLALGIDPLQERFHRLLMTAYYQSGDRAAALNQYLTCQRTLQAELAVEPDPTTTALRDAIASGQLPRRQPDAALAAATAPAPDRGKVASPLPAPAAPLVGREDEITCIEAVLARAAAGSGQGALLYGEAGAGKSRLLQEVLWRLSGGGATALAPGSLLLGHCYETARGLPYAPFVEALSRLLPGLEPGSLELPDFWRAEVSRLLPDLTPQRTEAAPPPARDAAEQQRRLFDGVGRLLAALPQPAVLVLEDIHWADPASLALLAYLYRQPVLRGVPILVTARAGDLPRETEHLLRQLHREGRLSWIDLRPLGLPAVERLVAERAGRPEPALARRLHDEGNGNALFVVETLRALAEGGQLQRPDVATLARLPLPAMLQAVVGGRLAALSPTARELMAALAVFPSGAGFALLQRVAGQTEEAALSALEELLRAGLVAEPQAGPAVEAVPAICFTHALARRVVRDGLSQARLEALHRRAYHELAADTGLLPRTAAAEAMALHATAGGLWEQGLAWSQEAAATAAAAGAHATEARCLEQALRCLDRLPTTPQRERQTLELRDRLAATRARHDQGAAPASQAIHWRS